MQKYKLSTVELDNNGWNGVRCHRKPMLKRAAKIFGKWIINVTAPVWVPTAILIIVLYFIFVAFVLDEA